MSSGAHDKQVIRKRTRKYGIFRIACLSIAQGCKNLVGHSHCTTKNLIKKRTLSLCYNMAVHLIFTPAYLCCMTLGSFGKSSLLAETKQQG